GQSGQESWKSESSFWCRWPHSHSIRCDRAFRLRNARTQGDPMIIAKYHRVAGLAVALVIAITAGCASSMPKPEYSRPIVADAHISAPDLAQVTVNAADDVKILPMEEERLSQKIKAKIDARKSANVRTGQAITYEVELHLTRYEKGNAFARAMLVGLGQIHIEGKVSLFQMPAHTLVGEFDLKKTF